MALHARELARCATTAMARQIQMCARRKTLHEGVPSTPQRVPVRGVTNSSSLGGGVGRGGGPGRGGNALEEGGNINRKGEAGKIRIKFATPEKILAHQRFLPEYARPLSRKAAKEPLGKSGKSARQKSDLADKEVGLDRKSKAKPSHLKSEVTNQGPNSSSTKPVVKSEPDLHFHRKEASNAVKARAGKFQKKGTAVAGVNQAGLTEPMSKLARDINQWFSEVVEHLEKAENAASTSTKRNESAVSSAKMPRTSKSSTPSPGAMAGSPSKVSRVDKQAAHRSTGKTTSAWAETRRASHKDQKSNVKAWKPRAAAAWGIDDPLGSNNVQRNLELQLSVLNADVERHHERNREAQVSLDSSRRPTVEGAQTKALGVLEMAEFSDRKTNPIMEIKPSLVENSEALYPLASAAGWWPYGAPRDALPDIPATTNKGGNSKGSGRSKVKTPTKSSGTAAVIASNVVSGSSKHKLATSSVSKSGSAVNIIKSSSKSSLEKGKGFILLSSKDKAKEADDNTARRSQSKTRQSSGRGSSLKSTSFILVEPNKGQDITTRSNRLLSDNPHIAAASRTNTKASNSNPNSPVGKQHKAAANTTQDNAHKQQDKQAKRRKSASAQDRFYFEAGPKPKAGSNAMDFGTTDQYARRWAEKVEQKLAELQAAKRASSKQAVAKQPTTKQTPVNKSALTQLVAEQASFMQGVSKATATSTKAEGSELKAAQQTIFTQSGKTDKTQTTGHSRNERSPSKEKGRNQTATTKQGSEGSTAISDVTSTRPLFGPLTQEQQMLLERIGNAGKDTLKNRSQESNGEIAMHPYLLRKAAARPVAVSELKPDIKSPPKKERTEKRVTKGKSEPRLFVTPAELASSKNVKAPKSAAVSTQTGLKELGKGVSAEPAYSEYDLWSNMLQTRMNQYRSLVQRKSDESKKGSAKSPTPVTPSPVEKRPGEENFIKASKDEKVSKAAETTSSKRESTSKKLSAKQKRASPYLTRSDVNVNSAIKMFQEQFLKQQHEKLIRSQKLKTKANKSKETLKAKDTTPISKANLPTFSVATAKTQREASRQRNTASFEGKSDPKEKINTSSAKSPSTKTATQKISALTTTTPNEIDPFEAWIKSMEEIKSPKETTSSAQGAPITVTKRLPEKPNKQINLEDKSTPGKTTSTTSNEPREKTQKKQYARFEHQPRPDIAQKVHRDICDTYVVARPESLQPILDAGGKSKHISKQPTTPNSSHSLLPESDQLYNQIKKGARNSNNMSPATLIVPGRRSKVLTQSGLGTVTDSPTGLVDPSRLPKLGNLFSTFDGFLAMDAVPVLDEPVVKSSASTSKSAAKHDVPAERGAPLKEAVASKASGDGFSGEDVRAILAKEREVASAAARRKMIEEYEKNIEKYEKGLEAYRSKLQQARQSVADSERPKPRSDNPRRHDP